MRVGRPSVKWTPEMEHTVVSMRTSGARFLDIAQSLGISSASVEHRYNKLKRLQNET